MFLKVIVPLVLVFPAIIDSICDVRGVHPKYCELYTKEMTFSCGGGESNQQIPIQFINDDYCDCVETGADEPGTNACNNGKFYCKNIGYRSKYIFSSFVNDGICDCCDGSDEWNVEIIGELICPNTCLEQAEKEIHVMKEQEVLYSQGLIQKKILLELSKHKIEEKITQQKSLKQQIHAQQAILNQLKLHHQEGEHNNFTKSNQELLNPDISDKEKTIREMLRNPPKNYETTKEILTTTGIRERLSRLSRERQMAQRKQRRRRSKEHTDSKQDFPYPEQYRYSNKNDANENANGFEDNYNDDEEQHQINEESSANQQIFNNLNSPELKEVWNKAEQELNKLKKEIADIDKFLAIDFGPDNIFALFFDECYEQQIQEYTYKICPFKHAQQVGSSSVRLGTFRSFEYSNSSIVMQFMNGDPCGKKVSRSLKVRFICSQDNQIDSVTEPAICVYEMIFKTPLACQQQEFDQLHDAIEHQFKQEL